MSSGQLKGWNAYIQASEITTFSGIGQWLSNFTGKTFEFYTNAQANVVNRLVAKDLALLPATNSTLTCRGLLNQEESTLVSGSGQFSYAPLSLLQQCASSGVSELADQLNYVPNVGGAFGLSTFSRILVVGGQPAENLSRFLSDIYDETYVNLSIESNLSSGVILSSFRAIVWVPSSNETAFSSAASLLGQYVRNGGELITTDIMLANSSALTPSGLDNASARPLLNASSLLNSAIIHTAYANDSFGETLTNSTFTARSPDLLVSATILGHGKVVLLDFGSSAVPQNGDEFVVVSNVISNAMDIQSPLWYAPTGSLSPWTGMYGVEGTYAGTLLVWVYNPTSSNSTFALNLNGSYYGVPPSWKTIQIPGPKVAVGSGSDVRIMTSIPAESLIAVLVVPANEPLIGYSSAAVQTEYTYPNQAVYSIVGTFNQSTLVMISTNRSASQILLNDNTSLPQLSTAGQLYSASSGWYFDGGTNSLFVKYQSTGADTLRYIYYTAPVSTPVILPQQMVVTVFEILILIEILTLAALVVVGRTRSRRQETIKSSIQ